MARTSEPPMSGSPPTADKLLRGARVAELPIEQPTQFELVVNMRTAAALGITFPEATLLFANRRIE